MSDMLPVSIPPELGVDGGEDNAGGGDAGVYCQFAGGSMELSAILDAQLAPEFYTTSLAQAAPTHDFACSEAHCPHSPPLSPPCSSMRARSRLNSLSSAPANCRGDSALYILLRRGARASPRRGAERARARWANIVAVGCGGRVEW